MAYTLANLQDDIRNYTEVGSNVLSDSVLSRLIKNAELKIHRAIDTDQSVYYATSNLIIGNRYVTIPADLRFIRYAQLKDSAGNQFFLEQRDTSFMAEYYSTPGTSAVDIPKYYANWDETFWVVDPLGTNYTSGRTDITFLQTNFEYRTFCYHDFSIISLVFRLLD